MFPDPDGLPSFHTTRRALFGRASCFDLHDVTAVQLCFVFEEGDELSPRRILLVPSIMRLFKHPFHVQVLHEYGIVLADKPRCNLVLVVQHFPTNVSLDFGNLQALFLIVARPILLPREFTLFASESFVLVFEVKPVHSLAVAGVDVVEDAEVNPNTITRVQRVHIGLLGQVSIVGFQPKGDEPFAGRLLLDGDFFDGGLVGNRTVVTNFDPADFAETDVSEPVSAPLFIEVETGLIVRHASIFGR